MSVASVDVQIYQNNDLVANQSVLLDSNCLCSFGRSLPSDKKINYQLNSVDHRIDFDFTRVIPSLAQGCSKYQAMIGFSKGCWVLIDGGFVKESTNETIRVKWDGKIQNLKPSHLGCYVNGRSIKTYVLKDGCHFNFLLSPVLVIIGVFHITQTTAGAIYDASFDTSTGAETILDNKPRSSIPVGATYVQRRPELESLSKISNPGIKLARRITDVVEDAADASDSYDKVARLFFKYVILAAVAAGLIVAIAWVATHVDWQRLNDARELVR